MPLPHRSSGALLRPLPVFALAAAVALGTAGCSGSSPARRDAQPGTSAAASTTTTPTVRMGACRTVASGAPVRLDAAAARAIETVGRGHLHDAVEVPLTTGRIGTGFLQAFEATAAARVRDGGPDRDVLSEVRSPLADTAPAIDAALACTVLGDRDGSPAAASLELRVTARGRHGATSRRTGELLLVPVAGAWKITGYDVTVTRDPGTGGVATTTSAAVTP